MRYGTKRKLYIVGTTAKTCAYGARRFHCLGERAIAKSKTPLEGRGSASWQQMIAGLSPALINRRSVSSSCRQTPQQQVRQGEPRRGLWARRGSELGRGLEFSGGVARGHYNHRGSWAHRNET